MGVKGKGSTCKGNNDYVVAHVGKRIIRLLQGIAHISYTGGCGSQPPHPGGQRVYAGMSQSVEEAPNFLGALGAVHKTQICMRNRAAASFSITPEERRGDGMPTRSQ